MAAMRQLAERNAIRAFRAGPYVLIVADGTLPNPGFKVDIVPNVAKIFPQQWRWLRRKMHLSDSDPTPPTS